MAKFPIFQSCQIRQFKRTSIFAFVYAFLVALNYLDSVSCATLPSSSKNANISTPKTLEEEERSSLSYRNLHHAGSFLSNGNAYFPVPSAFGVPAYTNFQQFSSALPFQNLYGSGMPTLPTTSKHTESTRLKLKISPPKDETGPTPVRKVEPEETSKKKNRKNKKQKTKNQKETVEKPEENGLEKVESKTIPEEGTSRGCPACVGGPCDANISPSTNISGIPLIQLLVALAVGAFWAAIFAFILHNFIEYQHGGGYEGGYDTPVSQYGPPIVSEYGPPQPEYGAPSVYGNHKRVSQNQGYGRRTGVTFNDVSNWVWQAIDKFASQYDNN